MMGGAANGSGLAPQILIAVFGLIAGSFASVCAYRLPRGLSLVRPGSRCPACGHPLAVWENLPLLGYLKLGGRCRACRVAIGWRYPLLELGCAAGFWWSWRQAGAGLGFVRGAFFIACLLILAATDLEARQLPDEITLGGWLVGLALAWRMAGAGAPGLGAALAASCGGAGLLALVGLGYQRLRGREGLGWGDVKMVGMLGAFLGIEGTLAAVLLASLGGAAVGLAQALGVMAQRRRRGQSWRRARQAAALFVARGALPLGVFLAAAGGAAWAWGPGLWRGWLI